jgi:hypothetical protein
MSESIKVSHEDYVKLLSYCAEIIKLNIPRFKDASLTDIKESIQTELENYEGDK